MIEKVMNISFLGKNLRVTHVEVFCTILPLLIILLVRLYSPSMIQGHICKVQSRILDILILQDKTLFCAFEDNFKQNGIFWRQHLLAVRV